MRVSNVRIENYKGLSLVELRDIADLPAVVLTGKNGTGKSLILEAIVFAWSSRYDDRERVGPWGDEMSIELDVLLTEDEVAAVAAWHEKAGWEQPVGGSHRLKRVIHSVRGNSSVDETRVVTTLRDAMFQRSHPFAAIDFLPATRQVPLSGNATVDLGLFNSDRQDQDRESYLDGFMNNRAPVTLKNAPSYLLTLDYQKLISDRQGLDVEDAYDKVTEPFRLATSKKIRRPEYLPAQGSTQIAVELPSGHEHELDKLSSGEQELLALQFFVRRLISTGGILLFDEPEQHLHPSLQATLLSSVQELSVASQIFVVSHSAPLISASEIRSLVRVDSPVDRATNQVQRVEEHDDLVDLLGELGLRKSTLVQADYVLLVEGDGDEHRLRSMFPAELAHAHVVVAGSGNQVVSMCRAYRQSAGVLDIPWIAIRDRDFLSDDEVANLTSEFPELHVHEGREIESILLNPGLISEVLSGIGEPVTIDEVNEALDKAADPLTSDVILELSRAEILRRFPPPSITSDDPWTRWKDELGAYGEINRNRAEAIDQVRTDMAAEVDRRWATEKLSLADPKIILKRLHNEFPRFRNHDALADALTARIRETTDKPDSPGRSVRLHLHRAQGLVVSDDEAQNDNSNGDASSA